MTENDYIAEYIKEKHSSLLGTDFALWKFKKSLVDASKIISDAFSKIDWREIGEQLEECKQCEYFNHETYECSYGDDKCKNEEV